MNYYLKRGIALLLTLVMVFTMPGIMFEKSKTEVKAAADDVIADFSSGSFQGTNMEFVANYTNPNQETYTTPVTREGRNGVKVGGYAYFKVTNNMITQDDRNLFVEITYYDEAANFNLQYNAAGAEDLNHYYKNANVTTDNSQTWCTTTICLNDASFRKKQNNGCDFRISGSIVIGKIQITKQSVNPKNEPKVTLTRDTSISEFTGKCFAGYQGWFRTSDRYHSWGHYANGSADADGTAWPRKDKISIDIWPDTKEYADSSLAQTGYANLGSGDPAVLFDSTKADVINTHFRWMREYGIDGAALQRFSPTITGRTITSNSSASQLYKIKQAAEANDRMLYIMYDISGGSEENTGTGLKYVEDIEFDWVYNIEKSLHMTESKSYATVDGKPVVCIWGLGVLDRPQNKAGYKELIDFFHDRGCYVIIGTGNFRLQTDYHDVYFTADMISPWAVGGYGTPAGVDYDYTNTVSKEVQLCREHNVEFYPVVFSGFSWALWQNGRPNMFPREAGQFFWRQAYQAKGLGINSFYIAMFDEYDEGTAVAKNASDSFEIPQDQWFLTASADGYWLSSDFQLRTVKDAIRMIKGEIPRVGDNPVPHSLGPVYYRNSFESRPLVAAEAQYSGDYKVDPCFRNNGQISGTNASSNAVIENVNNAKRGFYDVKFSGTATANNAKTEYRISETKIKLEDVMKLSYSVKAGNELGKNTYVDLICEDGTRISSKNISNNGVNLGAGSPKGNTSGWTDYEFTFETGNLSGKTVSAVALAYSGNAGDFTAYYDDIILESGNEGDIEGGDTIEENVYSDFTSGQYTNSNMDYVVNINEETNGAEIKYKSGKYALESQQGKYVYYKVLNDAVKPSNHDLYLHVTYLDEGNDSIFIQYNSNDQSLEGILIDYKSTFIQRTNSGEWKTADVHLTDAAFAGKQNNGGSFRLGSNDAKGLTVARIVVSENAQEAEDPVEEEESILRHGRTWYENDELKLAWTNSGFTFNFTGTGAKADISTTTTAEYIKGFFNVYVDGDLVPTKTFSTDQAKATYTLAEGLPNGNHTITVKKRNEAAYGGNATLGVSNIVITNGELTDPPAASNRKIEVIGDSITSGFTNMVEDGNGAYRSSNTEGTMTYAALTGKAFGTETSVLSRSGIRFVRTNTGESMIDYYPQVSGLTGNTDAWNFKGGSDVVVINLGTNDVGAKMNNSDANVVSDDYVKSEAKALLTLVRSKNPNAVIVWAYGIMGNGRSTAIQAAVNEMNDNNIFYLPLAVRNVETEGVGDGGHPTITTGINRSFDLVEFISQKTGWDYDYDAQLATQLWLLEKYDNTELAKYTQESAETFVEARNEALAFTGNESASTVKAMVQELQDARNGLTIAENGNGYDPNNTNKLCDLVVTNIQLKNSVEEGDEATFLVTIKNIGEAASPSNVKHGVPLFVDGTCVNWCDVYFGPMQPGEEQTVEMNWGPNNKATWTATAGEHTIRAMIDDSTLIGESDETNNNFTTTITIQAKPVITTYTVTLDGTVVATLEAGQTYTLPTAANVGYYGDGKLYKGGSTYTVTKDVSFSAVNLRMSKTPNLKYVRPAGLRFSGKIACNDEALFSSNAIVESGILVTPNDYLSNGSELSMNAPVKYTKIKTGVWVNNVLGSIAVSFDGIIEKNYERDFVSRGYMIVDYADGSRATLYSAVSTPTSVSELAYNIFRNKNVYNSLSADNKALIIEYMGN
jgi:lysophospholipase L1-like esterase